MEKSQENLMKYTDDVQSFIIQGMENLCKALVCKETPSKSQKQDLRLINISRLIRMKTYLDEEISKMKATLLKDDPKIDLSLLEKLD